MENILKMENICMKSSKIINYSAQSAEPDPGLQYVLTIWIFNRTIFWYAFIIVKKLPLYVNFSIPPCGK
jgi:hypothetical protein